jgi:hypothetical protein
MIESVGELREAASYRCYPLRRVEGLGSWGRGEKTNGARYDNNCLRNVSVFMCIRNIENVFKWVKIRVHIKLNIEIYASSD